MKYKARYFLIGGQEPQEEPKAKSIETPQDAIDSIDTMTDSTIDDIIDHIRKVKLDTKVDEGVSRFGKREYIIKVFELLKNDVQPIVPGMEGSGKKDIIKELEELTTSIKLYEEEFLTKTKWNSLMDAIDKTNKLIEDIEKEIKASKEKVADKAEEIIKEEPSLKEEVKEIVVKSDEKIEEKAIDLNKDIASELVGYINDIVMSAKQIKDINETDMKDVLKRLLLRGLGEVGKPRRLPSYDDVVNVFKTRYGFTDEEVNILNTSIKAYVGDTSTAPSNQSQLFKSVRSIIDNKVAAVSEITGDILNYGSGDGRVSFGNTLTLYKFPHIVEASRKGYENRNSYSKQRPQQLTLSRDGKEEVIEWTKEIEGSYRGETQLTSICKRLYPTELDNMKYNNLLQLVSKKEATEDIDIKLKAPGSKPIGFIELKGHLAANIEANKFRHMLKLYLDNSTVSPEAFYATARGNAPGMSDDELIDVEGIDVFPSFSLFVIPTELLDTFRTYQDKVKTATFQYGNDFMYHIRELLGYGQNKFGTTLPSSGGIIVSNDTSSDTFKQQVAEAKRTKLNPEKLEDFRRFLSNVQYKK